MVFLHGVQGVAGSNPVSPTKQINDVHWKPETPSPAFFVWCNKKCHNFGEATRQKSFARSRSTALFFISSLIFSHQARVFCTHKQAVSP